MHDTWWCTESQCQRERRQAHGCSAQNTLRRPSFESSEPSAALQLHVPQSNSANPPNPIEPDRWPAHSSYVYAMYDGMLFLFLCCRIQWHGRGWGFWSVVSDAARNRTLASHHQLSQRSSPSFSQGSIQHRPRQKSKLCNVAKVSNAMHQRGCWSSVVRTDKQQRVRLRRKRKPLVCGATRWGMD